MTLADRPRGRRTAAGEKQGLGRREAGTANAVGRQVREQRPHTVPKDRVAAGDRARSYLVEDIVSELIQGAAQRFSTTAAAPGKLETINGDLRRYEALEGTIGPCVAPGKWDTEQVHFRERSAYHSPLPRE